MMDFKEIVNKINLDDEQILEHLAFLRYYAENPALRIFKQSVMSEVNFTYHSF